MQKTIRVHSNRQERATTAYTKNTHLLKLCLLAILLLALVTFAAGALVFLFASVFLPLLVAQVPYIRFSPLAIRGGFLLLSYSGTGKFWCRAARPFQLPVEQLPEGIVQSDLKGHLLIFNSAAERITGVSAASALGRCCADVFRATDQEGVPLCRARCPLYVEQDPAHLPGPIEFKECLNGPDGGRTVIAHTAAPLKDRNGRIVGTTSILRDISREEESARLKSDCVSLVSHELQAPLSNITASATLLAQNSLDPETRDAMLNTIADESKRLSRMVHDILQAHRMEKIGIQTSREPLALVPFIERILRDYRLRHNNHAFHFEPPREPLYALGDPESLHIVLDNLIQNAIKYSPVGSAITCSAERQADYLLIRIADQGKGVSHDQRRAIFRPFKRGVGPDSKIPGIGLGLYLARMLVEAQGGEIWVESEPGPGSRFCFTLPVLRGFDEDKDPGYRR